MLAYAAICCGPKVCVVDCMAQTRLKGVRVRETLWLFIDLFLLLKTQQSVFCGEQANLQYLQLTNIQQASNLLDTVQLQLTTHFRP